MHLYVNITNKVNISFFTLWKWLHRASASESQKFFIFNIHLYMIWHPLHAYTSFPSIKRDKILWWPQSLRSLLLTGSDSEESKNPTTTITGRYYSFFLILCSIHHINDARLIIYSFSPVTYYEKARYISTTSTYTYYIVLLYYISMYAKN